MEPVLASCAADVSARIVRMVETLRACYEWTAEWLNPLFRTQSSGAWGPRGSDMPAAPHSRTRLEPMPTFTSGPPGGASGGVSSSTDNGDGTGAGAGGAESPAGHASSRTRGARAAHDAAREEAAASATAAAHAAAAREAARATWDARAIAEEAAAHREQERRARAEAERLRVEREARHARDAREAEAAQAAADAAAEAARQRAADAQGRQGPATQPQFPEPAVPNLGGRRPESAEEYGYSWAAIDSIAIEECVVVNPCLMLEDVPSQYTSAYAKAYVDIFSYISGRNAAGDEAGVVRGLNKWFLAADGILLRRPSRGSIWALLPPTGASVNGARMATWVRLSTTGARTATRRGSAGAIPRGNRGGGHRAQRAQAGQGIAGPDA